MRLPQFELTLGNRHSSKRTKLLGQTEAQVDFITSQVLRRYALRAPLY